MNESDIDEYLVAIKDWKSDTDNKKILNILLRCQKLPNEIEEALAHKLLEGLTNFHKAINKATKVD